MADDSSKRTAALQWLNRSPEPRNSCTVVVDEEQCRAVLFGGGQGRVSFNDTWQMLLDGSGRYRWMPLETTDPLPPSRWGHAAVCDQARHRMLVFGGKVGSQAANDVWEFDLHAHTWRQLRPGGSAPGVRVSPAAIYHPARRSMVIFGGTDLSVPYNDAWELDLERLSWQRIVTPEPRPSPRWGCGAAYDSVTDSILIVGGIDNAFLNDAWLLCLTRGKERWSRMQPSGEPPPGRGDPASCYDAARRCLYVYGGFRYPPLRFHGDIHRLDLTTNRWSRINPAGPAPSPRRCAAGLFDPRAGNFVVFGGQHFDGQNHVTCLNDLPCLHVTDIA